MQEEIRLLAVDEHANTAVLVWGWPSQNEWLS